MSADRRAMLASIERLHGLGEHRLARRLARSALCRGVMRFGAADWKAYVGSRGKNKGRRGWKNVRTGRITYKDRPPGDRGPAGGKSAARAGRKVATVEQVAGEMRAFKRRPTAKQTAKLLDAMMTLTVKGLTELKKRLGLKGSGPKSALARKLVERFFERPAKERRAADKPGGGPGRPPVGKKAGPARAVVGELFDSTPEASRRHDEALRARERGLPQAVERPAARAGELHDSTPEGRKMHDEQLKAQRHLPQAVEVPDGPWARPGSRQAQQLKSRVLAAAQRAARHRDLDRVHEEVRGLFKGMAPKAVREAVAANGLFGDGFTADVIRGMPAESEADAERLAKIAARWAVYKVGAARRRARP